MVRFDSVVKLILVPTRNDLDGLSTDLWWREEDYAQFRYDTYDRIIIVIVNFFVNPSRLLFRLSGQAMVTGVFTPPPGAYMPHFNLAERVCSIPTACRFSWIFATSSRSRALRDENKAY